MKPETRWRVEIYPYPELRVCCDGQQNRGMHEYGIPIAQNCRYCGHMIRAAAIPLVILLALTFGFGCAPGDMRKEERRMDSAT